MHDIEVEKFGVFFGAHKTPLMLDRLMFRLPREMVEPERQLFQTKWFDYRFMHPMLATYLYAHYYREAYRGMWKRHLGRNSARYAKGISVEDIFEGKPDQLTGILRGRQVADALGIPYPLYITLAMERAMGWKRPYLPRPAQLYSDQLINEVTEGWEQRLKSRLFIAEDPRYRLDRFINLPHQSAHQHWLMEQIAKRVPGSQVYLLRKYVYQEPMLLEDLAAARFGWHVLEEARASAA